MEQQDKALGFAFPFPFLSKRLLGSHPGCLAFCSTRRVKGVPEKDVETDVDNLPDQILSSKRNYR